MKSAKWWMGVFTAVATMLLAMPRARGEVTVTDVEARQRYPWNGLVDITCKVTGIQEEATGLKFAVATVDGESETAQEVSHVRVLKDGTESDDLTVLANGSYSLVWDARADMGEGQWDDMVVRVTVTEDDLVPRGGQLWEGGPIWADRNIGAENPWDYGLYFWWGDTVGHRPSGTTFSFNFTNDNSSISTYGKDYGTLQSEGWITATGVLASAHDAAHVHWGGAWRMPTAQELDDLCNKCDWTSMTTMNGVHGRLVRGRGAYAGNGIFLPAVGLGIGTSLRNSGQSANYWSSTPYSSFKDCAWQLNFSWSDPPLFTRLRLNRSGGKAVRAVRGFAD